MPDALDQLVRRWARTHGPFVAAEPAARFGVGVERVVEVLDRLVAAETLARGAFRPDGVEREWCDNEVLRLLRQRSLAVLRREVEPVEVEVLGRFLPAWQGVGVDARGIDRLYEVVTQLQGVAIPASVLERDVLSARIRDYTPNLLDELCAAGEVVWVGAGPIGRDDGRVLFYPRGSLLARAAPLAGADDRPSGDEHERLRAALAGGGARFFRDLSDPSIDDRVALEALWDLVWAGEVTNDAFAAVRALSMRKRTSGTSRRGGAGARGRPRLGTLSALGPPTAQGRWSLVDRSPADPTVTAHAVAAALLERHGVVTREAARGEGLAGGYAAVYPVLRAMEDAGRIRRGYFVSGLGGAQFALPGAVDRLRAYRDLAGERLGAATSAVVLAATDPANPYGVAFGWPEVVGDVGGRAARAAGSYVVLLDGRASLFVERRVPGSHRPSPFRRDVGGRRRASGQRPSPRRRALFAGCGREGRHRVAALPEGCRLRAHAQGVGPLPLMPEGDTIFRAAAALHTWLAGRDVTAARTTVEGLPIGRVIGRRIVGVEARAKHLLIRFEGGSALHTHMRMTGSWHAYPTGARWKKPAWQARVVLEAGDRMAVCFNAPVVELLATGGEQRHPALAGLGPDILVPPVDLVEVCRRAAQRPPSMAIGDLLLDQQVVSGIGNIWRCESLFVQGIDPRRARVDVDDATLAVLVSSASTLMLASAHAVGSGERDSGGGVGKPWVYGRARRPCRRCGELIRVARLGQHARLAYWCPSCQGAA